MEHWVGLWVAEKISEAQIQPPETRESYGGEADQ